MTARPREHFHRHNALKIRKLSIRDFRDTTSPIYDATPAELLGVQVYLVRVDDLRVERSPWRSNWELRLRIPHTNRGQARALGWLGTTDNIDRNAWGLFQIHGQSRTHLHLIDVHPPHVVIDFPEYPLQPASWQDYIAERNAMLDAVAREFTQALDAEDERV